jgi:hypothetical protein
MESEQKHAESEAESLEIERDGPMEAFFEHDIPLPPYREAAMLLRDFMLETNLWIARFGGDRLMAWEITLLATGQGEVIGCESAAELGKRWELSKQAITKQVEAYQAKVHIPPMIGQRDEEARDEMRKKRKAQLK